MRAPNHARAVRCIRGGFHRHDRAADPALQPCGEPRVGQRVKLELDLHVELECANDPEAHTSWLAMGGTVTQVRAPDRIVAELVATTDGAPQAS